MVVEEIRIPSGGIVHIHDDFIENTELVNKRLARLNRIITNSYKRQLAKKKCVLTAHKPQNHSN